MKIAKIEFREIVKGLYASPDEKGLVIDMFDLTGLEKNTQYDEVAMALISKIEENVSSFYEKIDGIVFDNRNYWELDLGDGFVLDLEALCSVFPNLKTVVCGGGEFLTTDYRDELRLMSAWDFCDLARTAYRNGNLEKAEYYYQWAEVADFYDCMHTCGAWLKENGRYDEAEDHFKKIAGEKDKYGAVNNSYAMLLDELGRYSEAQDYLRYVLYRRTYEDSREFAEVFLYDRCQNEDSPYWQNLCLEELNNRIRDYVEACAQTGKTPDIERILLNASNSEIECFADDARTKLMQIYGTGKYAFECGDIIEIPGFPDLDKFKELASDAYDTLIIRALYLDFVENWEGEQVGELCDDEIKVFERALLTIDTGCEILFWLYYKGEYNGTIEIPHLVDQHKAANLLGNDNVWHLIANYGSLLDDDEYYEYIEERLPLLEETYKIYPQNTHIATELLRNLFDCNITRFIEVLQNAPHECLEDFFGWIDEILFVKCEDIDNAEELEKYLLLILARCSELGLEWPCVEAEERLFWLYYVGRVPSYTNQEIVFPQLINIRKAAELMGKEELWEHGMIEEGFYIYDENGKNLRVLLEEAYKLYPENKYIVVELLGILIVDNADISRFIEVLRAASQKCLADFVEAYPESLLAMCELLDDETIEKYILAIIECCSDIESEYWDINAWKQLMLSLYQTGYYTEWYDQSIERPSLKNLEKANAFAAKYELEHSVFDNKDEGQE